MKLALSRFLVLSKNQQLITNNSMVLNRNNIRIFHSFWKRNDWQSASERI